MEGEANWRLFHGGNVPLEDDRKTELKRLLLDADSPGGRALWYRLFGHACLVSAGRRMSELRDFWTERLDREDFWERTSEGDFSELTQAIFINAVERESRDEGGGGEKAYYWRRVFYDIRKVHKMVHEGFPGVILRLVDEGHGTNLPQLLRTGRLPGLYQQRWIGTFGQSSDTPLGFIIRELVRLEVITDNAVLPYGFYVCRPVLRALRKIGWIPDEDYGYSGQKWLDKLEEDPIHGPLLKPFHDIPLLHMGITHPGGRLPRRPQKPL
jgi:hypothetical protein